MKVKIKIHTDLTDQMQTTSHIVAALQRLTRELAQGGELFVGKKITIYATDENEVGYLKVKGN